MSEEIANPSGGAMSMDAAIASLLPPPDEDKAAEPQVEAAPEPEIEADAAEAAETETEAEQEPPKPQKYRVKIAGEESEVDLDELLAGYQRDADYRRKTQAVAEERKAAQAERERYNAELTRLSQIIQEVAPAEREPDWLKLAKEDPLGYVEKRAEWDHRQRLISEAQERANRTMQQQRLEVAQAEAAKLREARKEWSDPKRFKAEFEGIVEDAGKFFGFSAQEVAQVLDHRTLLALADAVEYRRLKAQAPAVEKKVAAAPKVMKPGAAPEKADPAKAQEALRQKLKRDKSVDAAVAFLLGN